MPAPRLRAADALRPGLAEYIDLMLAPMDADTRFLMLYTLYRVHSFATEAARRGERERWQKAAAEGRVRTRKVRGRNEVKVWIIEEKI